MKERLIKYLYAYLFKVFYESSQVLTEQNNVYKN